MIDWNDALYDPIYETLGVPGVLTLRDDRAFSTITFMDKTTGVEIGTNENPVIEPAACVRRSELTALQIRPDDLKDATLLMNGFEWKVRRHALRPSPNGELQGELYLLLSGQKDAVAAYDELDEESESE